MTASIRHITPAEQGEIDSILAALPEGSTVEFAPGHYRVNLWLERSIALRGGGRGVVTLDGGRERPVIQVTRPECEVTIEGLTLKDGLGGAGVGGIVHIFQGTRVELRDCDLIGGAAEAGGGIFVRNGAAYLENCRLMGNNGKLAQAVWVYLSASAKLVNCLIVDNSGPGPAVTASWAGRIALERCTVITRDGTAALRVVSTASDAPRIDAVDCLLGDPPVEVLRGGAPEPIIALRGCALSAVVPREGIEDDGDNVIGELAFDAQWRLMPGSHAANKGAVIP